MVAMSETMTNLSLRVFSEEQALSVHPGIVALVLNEYKCVVVEDGDKDRRVLL